MLGAGAGHEGSGAGASFATGSQGRSLYKSGAAVLGGCAHPLRSQHFRRTLPTQGWAQRDVPPATPTGGLKGSSALSSQVATETSLLGPRGVPARAGRMSGHRGAGGDPGRASTLQLPGVAVGSHRDACRGRRMGKAYLSGCSMQDSGTHHPLPSCERPCPAPGNTYFSRCTQEGRVSWISSSRTCPSHQTLSLPRTLI